MPSPRPFVWLLRKEWRDLLVSKAWWVLLFLMGPLTGVSFISAIRTYGELSVSEGAGEALAPLIGIWAPTFSACELAAVFLLPFVAIRMVGNDRQSGALKIELQRRISPFARIGSKAVVALAGWLIAMLPTLSAILLWKIYGGHIFAPELATLIAGHILNAGLTIALGAAAASLTEHPSTAAILTLGVTVGSWIVSFFAALHGGLWDLAASFTPAAIVGDFQHGLLRANAALAALLLIFAGLSLAAIWQRLGVRPSRLRLESMLLLLALALSVVAASRIRGNWDLSENRANSFPLADEQALRSLRDPLKIVVHLAPEDPRRSDLERVAFSKLRRIVADIEIEYKSTTSTGMFEQTREGYGEIWYRCRGRQEMSRVTTAEGVLEAIYTVADLQLPKDTRETVYRGHPLAVPPNGAAAVFYGLWPLLTLLAAILARRRL